MTQHFNKTCKIHGELKSHELYLRYRLRDNWIEITCKPCRRDAHKKDYENTSRLDQRIIEKELYCNYCHETLLINKFSRSGLKTKYARCKHCASEYSKQYFRKHNLMIRYSITQEDYLRMYTEQNGVCAICKQRETRKNGYHTCDSRLCVDHNHKTGVVRGLLCSLCNSGIGHLKESPTLMRNAAAYLESQN